MIWLMFSKHLQELDFERLGEVVADMGFDGVDLTVREGGHIEPADAKERLPVSVQTLKRFGLTVPMITTNFTDATEPYANDVFAVAADCGVEFIKLGYWRYQGFGQLKVQISEAKRKLDGIAQLSERYGVCAVVHNHSGGCLSASPFVLAELLRDFDLRFVAAYIDAGHITVEGGLTGWQQGLEAVADKVRVIACKDFGWFRENGRWVVKVVPVGEGIVRWWEFFACLKQIGFDGPISIHSEYAGLAVSELIEQTHRDVRLLKSFAY